MANFVKIFQLFSPQEEDEDKNNILNLLPQPKHPEKYPASPTDQQTITENYPAVKPDLKGGTTNFDEVLQTLTPDDVLSGPYQVDELELEGETLPSAEEKLEEDVKKEIEKDKKEYPKFTTAFQAFRWAKQNREAVRIYYHTVKGTFIIRDIEPHGDFWARTTLKRILVTWDETVGDIRAFRLENVEKYEFKNETFTPKFNFSQRQHNYRRRIRNRKDKRKKLNLMKNPKDKKMVKLFQIINDPKSVGMNYIGIGHKGMEDYLEGIKTKRDEKVWYWDENSGLKIKPAFEGRTHRELFPTKNMHFYIRGRYENINGRKRISIQKPVLGGESSQNIPPELIWELKEEFGQDTQIYIF